MAKRKQKTVYLTPEPIWENYKGLVDPMEQANAYQNCQYFIRTEINDKKRLTVIRKWIKEDSGWPKKDIEIILRNPDWAFNSSSSAFFFKSKFLFAQLILYDKYNYAKTIIISSRKTKRLSFYG